MDGHIQRKYYLVTEEENTKENLHMEPKHLQHVGKNNQAPYADGGPIIVSRVQGLGDHVEDDGWETLPGKVSVASHT